MSSLTGISVREPRLSRRAIRMVMTLGLLAFLAGLLTVVGFHTTDPAGMVRVRTAPFIWRIVNDTFEHITGARGFTRLFQGSLAITTAGFFILLWLAPTVGDEPAVVNARRPIRARLDLGGAMERAARLAPTTDRLCIAALAALAAYVAMRLGLFAAVGAADSPNTFSSLDHPFHIVRAQTLLRSLADGHLLRWVAHHHGGYPTEFYPLGFAWFEVAIWVLMAGQLSIPIVHRIAVIALFVAPGALFLAMSRRDRWPTIVALAAFALHLAIPGDMWAGGYTELVLVGLAPNVSAALLVLVAMTAASESLTTGSRRAAAVSALAAAGAIWCNPRSGLGLLVCFTAAGIMVLRHETWRRPAAHLVLIASAAGLLAAPELVSLIRFRHLYYFIRYNDYRSSLDYVASSIDVVSVPGFVLAIVGTIAAFRAEPRHHVTRTAAVALLLFVPVTLILSYGATDLIPQLETTRLMPVQRILTVYLAAVGLHAVASAAAERWPLWFSSPIAIGGATVAALVVTYLGPFGLMPVWERGLYATERSGTPEMSTFQQVIKVADQYAPPGTAILVIGDAVGEGHHQLWSPLRVERPFFYDDWMWYWHTRHRGPYNAQRVSKYEEWRLPEVLDRDYLDRNAIGAIVIDESFEWLAEDSPWLRRVFGGTTGLFTVVNPVNVVSFGGNAAESIVSDNDRVVAVGTSGGGDALVRRNWFPRWKASVNGRPAPVFETDDGYMRVPIPAGAVALTVIYTVDWVDTIARVAFVIGLAFTFTFYLLPFSLSSLR